MTTMNKEIIFRPAYDKRDPEPSKNYGIHGVDMVWYLKGELGVVQFVVYTNWHLRHVQQELDNRPVDTKYPHLCCHPQPVDVGYHSPKPMYEGQSKMECHLLPGGKCYYDGSGLWAEDVFNILVEKGSDAVWIELENTYKERFGELK